MFVNDIFKKQLNETVLNPRDPQGDYDAKRKVIHDLSLDPAVDQQAVLQRRLDLDKEAKAKGLKEQGIEEAGPFSYGAKKPRKGSVADLAAQKRKEQEKDKQPIQPRDQMVGVGRVKTDVEEALGLYGPFTVTINTGERPQSRTKTKKFRREDDAILWAQDWLEDAPQYVFATAEVTDPDGNVVWTTDESLEEQGVAEAHGPYGQLKAKDLERIKKAKEREKKDVPGQLTRPPTSKQRYPDSALQYFSKFDEGSAQDKLYKRHQELRKKSGLPDPDYYKELKATYDLPDEERYAKQKEIKQKYKVTNEDREQYIEELQRAGYEIVNEKRMTCPECGGAAYSDQMLAEKQDACYHKVKSRYKVWPSAYASGALVRCRKKGAKNWGNKSK